MEAKLKTIFRNPVIFSLLIIGIVTLVVVMGNLFLPASLKQSKMPDYQYFYAPVAQSLIDGAGFRVDGNIVYRYPPGHPILIALSMLVASFLRIDLDLSQLLFSILYLSGSAIVLLNLSKQIYGENWLVWIVPLVFITYPFYIWIALKPNSETPFILFLFLGLSFLLQRKLKGWHFFISGLFIGISMLIRPIAIGLGLTLAFLILIFLDEKLNVRILFALLLVIGNLLTVLPWEVFLYQETGQIIPLSDSASRGIWDGLTFAIQKSSYRSEVDLPENVIALMHSLVNQSDKVRSTKDIPKFLLLHLEENPLSFAQLYLIKAARSWYATDSGHRDVIILFIQIPYLLISSYAFYCCIKLGEKYSWLVTIVGATVLYFWIMTILALSILRYIIPVMGLMFILWPSIPIYISNRALLTQAKQKP